jgi:hypothetical protein
MHCAEYPISTALCMLRTVEPIELNWGYLQDCYHVSGIALILSKKLLK